MYTDSIYFYILQLKSGKFQAKCPFNSSLISNLYLSYWWQISQWVWSRFFLVKYLLLLYIPKFVKVVNCHVLRISIDLAREGRGIHLLFLFSHVSCCTSRGCKNKMYQQQLFNKNKTLYAEIKYGNRSGFRNFMYGRYDIKNYVWIDSFLMLLVIKYNTNSAIYTCICIASTFEIKEQY